MTAIMHGDLTQWYQDGDEKRSWVYHGTKFTLDTKRRVTLSANDWFVVAGGPDGLEGGKLHLWGDEDKFNRDVTLLRLFGIPSTS